MEIIAYELARYLHIFMVELITYYEIYSLLATDVVMMMTTTWRVFDGWHANDYLMGFSLTKACNNCLNIGVIMSEKQEFMYVRNGFSLLDMSYRSLMKMHNFVILIIRAAWIGEWLGEAVSKDDDV